MRKSYCHNADGIMAMYVDRSALQPIVDAQRQALGWLCKRFNYLLKECFLVGVSRKEVTGF